MPTSLWGIAAVLGVAEASISEEPGAEIPHAGIRAGRGRETAPSTATVPHGPNCGANLLYIIMIDKLAYGAIMGMIIEHMFH